MIPSSASPQTTWLFESMVDAALAVDVTTGRILAANEEARRLLTPPERELVGASVLHDRARHRGRGDDETTQRDEPVMRKGHRSEWNAGCDASLVP